MGRNIDAAVNDKLPLRISPFEFAEVMNGWNPRECPADVLDIPPSENFAVVPLDLTSDANNRIDFNFNEGWRYRKLTGYVASIYWAVAKLINFFL